MIFRNLLLLFFLAFFMLASPSAASAYTLEELLDNDALQEIYDHVSSSLETAKTLEVKKRLFLGQKEACQIQIQALAAERPEAWRGGCLANMQALIIYGLNYGVAALDANPDADSNEIWVAVLNDLLPSYNLLLENGIMSAPEKDFIEAFGLYIGKYGFDRVR